MTVYEKTIRLARLIGLDYHASESKRKVWRQVKGNRPKARRGTEWYKWHPYGLFEDYLIVVAWVRREYPASALACGCKVMMPVCYQQYCDAVLAAFDKQHEPNAPAEHNDAMRDSIGTHSDAITSELMPYGTAAKHRRQFQRLSRLRCAAALKARAHRYSQEAAVRVYRRLGLTFPDQLEQGVFGLHMQRGETLLQAMKRWYIEFDEVRQADRERAERAEAECNRLSRAVSPGEGVWLWQGDGGDHVESLVCQVLMEPKALLEILTECDKLRDQVDDAKHGTELAESALAGERQECDKLREALADADRDECCAAYKAQQRAEIERLTDRNESLLAQVQRYSISESRLLDKIEEIAAGDTSEGAELQQLRQFRDSILANIHEHVGNAFQPFAWIDQRKFDVIKAAQAAERGE